MARHERLNWDLVNGKPVTPKFARDFLRLVELARIDKLEPVWHEHRKPASRESFANTVPLLRQAIASRKDLLIPPPYSTDIHEVCSRCLGVQAFPLAIASQVLTLLGYC